MSEDFIVSARKYRPATFESVVGQKSLTTTLKNAIRSNQLAHAYLFCGPRGVGKTTCARIFAKTINCQNLSPENEACNECVSCVAFNTSRSMNIHELDAASNNSVDDIRKLIEQVRIPPQIGKYSVYIIDEVHMLSSQAFNAFLKTLEEPPKHAIFILATTEKHKILPTILSRCQIFDFSRIQVSDIADHLAYIAKTEGIKAEALALSVIAQKADGGLRDALSFFDQIASFSEKDITYEKAILSLNVLDYDYYFKLTDYFLKGDYIQALIIYNNILNRGFDSHNFLLGIGSHFRDLLVAKNPETLVLLDVAEIIKNQYKTQAQNAPVQFIFKALDILSNADVNYKTAQNKRLFIELTLLQISQILANLQNKPIAENVQNNQVQTNINQSVTHNTKPTETKVEEKKSVTTLPSINNMLNTNLTKEKPIDNQNITKENVVSYGSKTVNLDEVKKGWLEFAESIKQSNPRTYSVFTEYDIKLIEKQILLKVSNESQKINIQKLRSDILTYLNKKYDTKLDLLVEVSEVPIKSKMPYTMDEKLEYLKEINPELETLKNQFKLFID